MSRQHVLVNRRVGSKGRRALTGEETHDEPNKEDDDEDHEQDARDVHRFTGDAGEAEQTGDEREYEECECPAEHG